MPWNIFWNAKLNIFFNVGFVVPESFNGSQFVCPGTDIIFVLNKFVLLFIGSPLRVQRINLCEDLIENTFRKRLVIKSFIEEALIKFQNLEIIYKPFPYTDNKDPINL